MNRPGQSGLLKQIWIRRCCGTVAGPWNKHRSASKFVVNLPQQLVVLDIRRDFGWQRRLRVGLDAAVAAKPLRVRLAPESGIVSFPE